MRKTRTSKVPEIVADLERILAEKPDFDVFSISALAEHFGVSCPTMSTVVHALKKKGLLAVRNGRGIARVKNGDLTGGFVSVTDKLFQTIANRISDGSYQTGNPLPKRDYFVLNEHISPVTVARTFAHLIKSGLVHRQGKSLIVGPSPRSVATKTGTTRRRPTIVLLLEGEDETRAFMTHSFLSPFVSRFFGETDRYGILVSYASIDRGSKGFPLNIPAGMDAVQAHIAELGPDYVGTLVTANPAWVSDLGDHIVSLARFDKPVVYFDSADAGRHLTRSALSLGKETYFRCHFDERTAVRIAADRFHELGHRTIGIPMHSSPRFTWAPRREALIRSVFDEHHPGCTVWTASMDEVFWQFDRDFSPASFLTEFKAQVAGFSQRQGVTKVPSIRERLLQCTPSMTSLFDRGITALVGLSDFFTAEIYLWLRSAEILIPDFASLVSFDNIVGSHIFPVSSVDFGFAALGYQAAHLFVGDIPIRADRNGNVPAPCTLIDRGSIAPPPDRGSQIRTLTR